MYIKHLADCPEFVAGDNSHLREILNPRKENLAINYSLAWASVKPGERTVPHRLEVGEVYYILNGVGEVHIDNEQKSIQKSDTFFIPQDAVQFVENTGEENLEFLCIVEPAWQPEIEHILNDSK